MTSVNRAASRRRAIVKYGRVDELRVADLSNDQRELLGKFVSEVDENLTRSIPTDSDSVPGAINYLLIDPNVGAAMFRLGAELNGKGKLPERLRELVILETARGLRCETEWLAHNVMGRSVGLTDAEIDAVLHGGETPGLTAAESVALRLARGLVIDHDVPDALYEEALQELGMVLLFDVVMLSAFYTLMSYPMTAFRGTLPEGSVPVL